MYEKGNLIELGFVLHCQSQDLSGCLPFSLSLTPPLFALSRCLAHSPALLPFNPWQLCGTHETFQSCATPVRESARQAVYDRVFALQARLDASMAAPPRPANPSHPVNMSSNWQWAMSGIGPLRDGRQQARAQVRLWPKRDRAEPERT